MRPETKKLYERHKLRWIKWCAIQGIDPLAPPSDAVLGYLRDLSTRFAHVTVQQHRAAIRDYHLESGLGITPFRSFDVDELMRDLRGRSGESLSKVAISTYNVRRLLVAEGPNRLRVLRDRAMFALAWYFRPGDIFRLQTSHIVSATGAQIVLQLDGKRTAIDDNAPVYAVTHLIGWLKAAGITSGRLLRNTPQGGGVGPALSPRSGSRRLKAMLAEIGVRAEWYSLQSLRKGRSGGDSEAPAQRPSPVIARSAKQPSGVPMETIAAIWATEDAEKGVQ